MKIMFMVAVFLACFSLCVCAPVSPNLPEKSTDSGKLALEYRRYLKAVSDILQSDEDFSNKIRDMEGERHESVIAEYLQFANERTREELNQLKRAEVRRLKDLHKKLDKAQQGDSDIGHGIRHLDHNNRHSFEMQDLKKLIAQSSADMQELDNRRRREFQQYEMQKEHEKRVKMETMTEEEKIEFLKEEEERLERHRDHPKVNHPGNKKQLEEVWSEEDHMDQAYDPRTFFMLHDIDGDGYLNVQELEALFQRELDKVYDPENADDDMVERNEEMNRMREHVFTEYDSDKDGMISWKEFDHHSQQPDFNKDEEWDTLDEEKTYNDKEMEAFEKALTEKEKEEQQKKKLEHFVNTKDDDAPALQQDAGIPQVPNEIAKYISFVDISNVMQ